MQHVIEPWDVRDRHRFRRNETNSTAVETPICDLTRTFSPTLLFSRVFTTKRSVYLTVYTQHLANAEQLAEKGRDLESQYTSNKSCIIYEFIIY